MTTKVKIRHADDNDVTLLASLIQRTPQAAHKTIDGSEQKIAPGQEIEMTVYPGTKVLITEPG